MSLKQLWENSPYLIGALVFFAIVALMTVSIVFYIERSRIVQGAKTLIDYIVAVFDLSRYLSMA